MDEKDLIIQKLRREIDTLRKNEKDFSDLNFLLTNLEHRYNLLNEEKVNKKINLILARTLYKCLLPPDKLS